MFRVVTIVNQSLPIPYSVFGTSNDTMKLVSAIDLGSLNRIGVHSMFPRSAIPAYEQAPTPFGNQALHHPVKRASIVHFQPFEPKARQLLLKNKDPKSKTKIRNLK